MVTSMNSLKRSTPKLYGPILISRSAVEDPSIRAFAMKMKPSIRVY